MTIHVHPVAHIHFQFGIMIHVIDEHDIVDL